MKQNILAFAGVLARNLNFMPLSRWHHRLAGRLEAVERSMEFENKSVEEICIAFSKVMREFQNNSPIVYVDGVDSTDQQE
jgi:hypothetical protein